MSAQKQSQWFKAQPNKQWPWIVTAKHRVRTSIFNEVLFGEPLLIEGYVELTYWNELWIGVNYASNGITGVPMFIQRTILLWAVGAAIVHDVKYQLKATFPHADFTRWQIDWELLCDWIADAPRILKRIPNPLCVLFALVAWVLVRLFGWWFLERAKRDAA